MADILSTEKAPNILDKNRIPITIILVALLVGAGILYFNYRKTKPEPKENFVVISAEDAGKKALDYINQTFLQGQPPATLKETTDESGVYKLRINVDGQEGDSYITKDGKLLFPAGLDISTAAPTVSPTAETTVGDFSVANEEICSENGKPLVYFFGSQTCPHCQWEHPIFQAVLNKFTNEVAFHDNMDSDNDAEVFQKFSTGGIPTAVLGCKYFRVGSGENAGEETEAKNLTALICKITGNKPANVCQEVQDLINTIKS